jgi:hypothetical protein
MRPVRRVRGAAARMSGLIEVDTAVVTAAG